MSYPEPRGIPCWTDLETPGNKPVCTLTQLGQQSYDGLVERETRGPISRHSIGVVSRRTGLKPDVIRAWERRYGAIVPSRSGTNRRYYTDGDVERLILLRQATLSGRQIGQIGDLSTGELKELVSLDQEAIANAPRLARPRGKRSENGSLLAASLAAVEDLDAQELQYLLERAMVELSPQKVIEDLIVPAAR